MCVCVCVNVSECVCERERMRACACVSVFRVGGTTRTTAPGRGCEAWFGGEGSAIRGTGFGVESEGFQV